MTEDIYYTAGDGLKLYARSYGPDDAPLTVLCMHGLTRNHKDFEPMIAHFGERYRFIAVDVRGRGMSDRDPNPEHYTPLHYAQDMTCLIKHLQLDQVVLIGTSMGALMSMLMVQLAPEHIRAVVMNDVGPIPGFDGVKRIASYVGKGEPEPTWGSAAQSVAASQGLAFPDYDEQDWLAFARRTYRETEDGKIVLDYDPAISQMFSLKKPGFGLRFAMWRLFSKMKPFPLLVIRGELSDILPEKTARKMLKRHGGATLVTVPNRGHAPMLDEPEAIRAIDHFLSGLET